MPEGMAQTEVMQGGQVIADDTRCLITLLGSCVAACLYDPQAKIAGMNHFLLANPRYSRSMPVSLTDAGRYGLLAMELLINGMLKKGAKKERLRAKVFGGGAVLPGVSEDNFNCVGNVNSRFVREFMQTEKIPLESEDLGGNFGRIIVFRTDTYQAYRRVLPPMETVKEENRELGAWKQEIKERERKTGEGIILFGP